MRPLRFYIRYDTLRSVQAGWSAKGRLEPIWKSLDPPKADTLADLSGVHVKTIYMANSGKRPLGYEAGAKIASAAEISIYDIGAPRPAEATFAASILGQIVAEMERHPPPGGHLRELAGALRGLAARLEAVADAQDGETLPA